MTTWTKTTDPVSKQQTWTAGDVTIVRAVRGVTHRTSLGRGRSVSVRFRVYRGEVRVKNQIGDEGTLAAAKAIAE